LLINLSNVSYAAIRILQLVVLYQVVCNIPELSVMRVQEVRGNGDSIVWLQCEREELIIHDDNLTEVNAFQHSQVFNVHCLVFIRFITKAAIRGTLRRQRQFV